MLRRLTPPATWRLLGGPAFLDQLERLSSRILQPHKGDPRAKREESEEFGGRDYGIMSLP